MSTVISALLATLSSVCQTRAVLQLEILALRHQLGVLRRSSRKRPRLTPTDRILGMAVTSVARLASGTRHRQAGNGHRLASPRLPTVLDLEEPSPRGSTDRPGRCEDADSHHVRSESTLGCAAP